jgi:hypothetical protein
VGPHGEIGQFKYLGKSKAAVDHSSTGPPKTGGYSVRMLAERKVARNAAKELVGRKSKAYSAKSQGALSVAA